ncbi:hypothetical protein ACFX2I_013344 [Malus domestica]
MLSRNRTKHGGPLIHSSLLFKLVTHFSPFSSKPNSNFATQNQIATIPKKFTTRRSIPLPATVPQAPDAVSSSIVSSVCSLLSKDTNESTSIDILLKKLKKKLSSELVLQILMNYKQLGRSKALDFFSWAGFQMGFRFDDCVVEYMADFLGRRKLFDDMKCLLLTVSSHKGRVSCRAVSICIRFLGRQGRIREALCTFEEMESKFGCKPDNLVYNNVLYVLCKKESSGHLIDFALAVFRRIESPDTYSYGNILVGLCKFGRFETAIEVFGDMCKSGVVPTRSAVNALIGELCSFSAKEGAVGKVRMRNSCRNFTILVPKVGGNSDAIQPAVGIFWAVYKVGLLPSTFAIIQLLSGLCQLGKVEEAVEILKAVEGNLDDAGSVFKMMNKNRCLPDSMTYSALIHAYGEAKNWEASYGLLIEMLGLGYSPHFHTYRLVDKILRENGQMDMCLKLERKLETQMLQKLCKDGQLEAAHEKLKSMIGKGFHPPAYVRHSFENAFRRYGKLKIAQELLRTTSETDRT